MKITLCKDGVLLIWLILLLFYVSSVYCDGCLAKDHLIPPNGFHTTRDDTRVTCIDKKDGGGLAWGAVENPRDHCNGAEWVYGIYRRCMKRALHACECSAHHCNDGTCWCGMGGNDEDKIHQYCWASTKPCIDQSKTCSPGQVQKDCGCSKTGPILWNTDMNSPKTWVCSDGSCINCPKGYRCPADTSATYAIPCDNVNHAQYQDEEGKTSCKICACPPNQFKTTNYRCDQIKGPEGCGVCDGCSENSECLSRNYAYGKNRAGVCTQCENAKCQHPNYVRGDPNINYCYLSSDLNGVGSPLNQICAPLYFDISIPYMDSSYQQEGFQADISSTEIKRGPMPWKAGYQRTQPIYPIAKLGPSSGGNEVGRPGQLPFYRKCYNDPLPETFRWTRNITKIMFLNRGSTPWDHDCEFVFAQDCENSRPIYDKYGYLSRCEACKDESVFSNGVCVCPDGKMSSVNLSRPEYFMMQLRPETYCLPCNGLDPQDIRWRKKPGIWVTEAFRCTYKSGIELADNPYQFLRDNQWTACENGSTGQFIPDTHRTACILCPSGKYISNEYDDSDLNSQPSMKRLKCEVCSSDKYQDKSGQFECIRKRTKCEKNMQLNYDNINSKTEDYKCVPCKSSCGSGEIQVYQDNSNDTCNGEGLSYFGCFPWTSAVSFPMNMRFKYTTVPITKETSVKVEECDSRLLPEHSYFVSLSQRDRNGKQCYFACLHGVNQVKQVKAHVLEKEYASIFNKNLLRFLSEETDDEIDGNVGNDATSSQKRIRIPSSLRSMDESLQFKSEQDQDYVSWMKPDALKNMNVRTNCYFCGKAYKQNTFLFIDALLGENKSVMERLNISTLLNPYKTGLCKSHEEAYRNNKCNAPLRQTLTPLFNYATKDNMKREDTRGSLVKCAYDARTSLVDYNNGQRLIQSVALSSYTSGTSLYSEICRLVTTSSVVINYNHSNVSLVDNNNSNNNTGLTTNEEPLNNLELWEMVGCTDHCLNYERRKADTNMANMLTTSKLYLINVQLSKYLMWKTWSSLANNPYIPTQSSTNCSFTCDPMTSVYIKLSDFQGFIMNQMHDVRACIPCKSSVELIASICALNDKVPASTMTDDVCLSSVNKNANQQQTINDICQRCNPLRDGASLLSRDPDSNSQINAWNQQRSQEWANRIQCKYVCSVGYFPNYALDEYETNPCLSCSGISAHLCRDKNSTADAFFKEGPDCEFQNRVQQFEPRCISCRFQWKEQRWGGDIDHIYFKSGIYDKSSPCLARCYEGKYHSFDRRSGGSYQDNLTLDFVPMPHLICSNCSEFPRHPCNGKCQDNYFHVGNECKLCNISGCPDPSQYREKCDAGNRTMDAVCETCPLSYLSNNDDKMRTITRKYVFISANDVLLRKRKLPVFYLSNVPVLSTASATAQGRGVVQQCILTCKNNYVWIDVQTNTSPFINLNGSSSSWPIPYDHSRYKCVPCDNILFKNALRFPDKTVLYSVWNQTGNSSLFDFKEGTSNTVLFQMTNQVEGSCYACLYSEAQETTDESVSLCVTKPGYCGSSRCDSTSGTIGTILQTARINLSFNNTTSTSIIVTSQTTSNRKPTFWNSNTNKGTGGRRLLLQATDEQQEISDTTPIYTRRIKMYRIPKMRPSDVALCCNIMFTSEEEKEECRTKRSIQFQIKRTRTGKNIGQDFCDGFSVEPTQTSSSSKGTSGRRRRRRNLLQWTTTNTDTTSRQEEEFSYIEESEQKCPVGTFKKEFGEDGCSICPSGSTTRYPYTGSTSLEECVCQEGYKTIKRGYTPSGIFELECHECGIGWFRSDNSNLFLNDTYCLECPINMTTPTTTSSECFCKPGYYHSYNNNWTITKPPCILCPENYYCIYGIQYACPPFSTTMGRTGASQRSNCICNNKTHYGNLKEQDSQCIEIPPGIRCLDGSWDCECALGWIKVQDPYNPIKRARCITACPVGEYVTIDPTNGIASACQQCPKNTYSDKIQAIGVESCIPCPPNTYTSTSLSRGASNISDCLCADPKSPSAMECGVCPEGSYQKSQEENICMECPTPLSSNRGSTGILACMLCPKGYQTIKKAKSFLSSEYEYACTPCPIGTFSARKGIACSKCPRGYSTLGMGSVSMNQCVLITSL